MSAIRTFAKENKFCVPKPKVYYKSLNAGKSIRYTEYKKPAPPRFGWNTESSSSDDEDLVIATSPIITQFRNWFSRQSEFVPKSSVFLHWFRDKYPSMDILAFETAVRIMAQNVLYPVSSSNSATEDSENRTTSDRSDEVDESFSRKDDEDSMEKEDSSNDDDVFGDKLESIS